MHVARKVYEQFLNGDTIVDGELEQAFAHFQDVSSKLMVLGPTFKLAALEAHRVADQLDEFIKARAARGSIRLPQLSYV